MPVFVVGTAQDQHGCRIGPGPRLDQDVNSPRRCEPSLEEETAFAACLPGIFRSLARRKLRSDRLGIGRTEERDPVQPGHVRCETGRYRLRVIDLRDQPLFQRNPEIVLKTGLVDIGCRPELMRIVDQRYLESLLEKDAGEQGVEVRRNDGIDTDQVVRMADQRVGDVQNVGNMPAEMIEAR